MILILFLFIIKSSITNKYMLAIETSGSKNSPIYERKYKFGLELKDAFIF